jgi:hypothetical protein
VCRFHVDTPTSCLSGALVWSVTKLASITLLSLVLSPTGSIYLGFITEGRLAVVLITPSLGVPNWSVLYINTAPSEREQANSEATSSFGKWNEGSSFDWKELADVTSKGKEAINEEPSDNEGSSEASGDDDDDDDDDDEDYE